MGAGAVNDEQLNDAGGDGPKSFGSADSSGGSDATPDAAGAASSRAAGPADLPDFELLAEIGRGGFGSVWIAKHRHTGDAVAIKFIPPRSRDTELKGLQMLRQRVREGQDHLVWTEYIGESGDFIYCVMDLADNVVDGPLFPDRYEALTLLKYLKQHGRLDLADARTVILSMAKGLAFLQKVGLRHGDVKPANVLRVRGRWKLADYGMMGGLDARARGGTRSYVPPEGPHGERADQYALGIVLHELVFGTKPSKESVSWPPSRLGTGLRRICERMLDPQESRRFASMGELVEALESLGERRGGAATGASACPHCGEPVDGEQEVCGGCGGDLWQTCPACQHRGSVLQRFCTKCRAPVHAIAALEQELSEAAALLPEGRHREVVSRAEGPLADLCNEVEHQLSRMQGGDLARTRRATEIREGLDGRRRRLIEQANRLRGVDERIATAHAEGLITELRVAVEEALQLLPESPNYRRLKAELPRLEAQATWNALLTELGSPQKDPTRLRGVDLRRAIRTIKVRTPDDPEVRKEADRLVDRLVEEQSRRLRHACVRRATRHRNAGRPIEALESLRSAEASGVADDEVRAEIAVLARDLGRERLPSLLETLEGDQAKRLSPGRLRRSIREVEAIRPDESRLSGWRLDWARRRRLNLLRRIKDRCLAAIAAEDVAGWQHHLALAYRVAGRDADLADRVLELDNALQARWNALAVATRDAAAAEAAGDVMLAHAKWREAAAIASRSPAVAERLESARVAAEAYPRRRRRRLIVVGSVATVLIAALAGVGWQAWNWWRLDRWLATSTSSATATVSEYRQRLQQLEDRTIFPFGSWGLRDRVLGAWWATIDDRVSDVPDGRDAPPEEVGDLVAGYRDASPLEASMIDARLADVVGAIETESPDPARLVRVHRLIEAAGGSGGLRERVLSIASPQVARIAAGDEVPGLEGWWAAFGGDGVGSAEIDGGNGTGLEGEVRAAFAARCRLEAAGLEELAGELDAALAESARRGLWTVGAVGQRADARLGAKAPPWCASERFESARALLARRLALLGTWSDGVAEVPIAPLGQVRVRLTASGDGGRLVASGQIDEGGWREWLGRSDIEGPAVPIASAEVVRLLATIGPVEFGGVRWRAYLPDREEWSRLEAAARIGAGDGLREDGEPLEDLVVARINGTDRAFRMPSAELWSVRGSIDVGLRLFLRPE